MKTYTCIVYFNSGRVKCTHACTVDAKDEREAEAVARRRTHRAWGRYCKEITNVEMKETK